MKYLTVLFTALFMIMSAGINAETGNGSVKAITMPEENLVVSDKDLPKVNRSSLIKGKKNGGISIEATADPLWYVEISYVYSSNVGGWQPIAESATSTSPYDHGGAQMRVTILELGYGGSRVVKMNGGVLSSSANYYNDDICWDFSGNLTYNCQSGMTLAGYERYYNIDGYQNGYFEFQSTSIVSPWNTEYDSISIL